MNARHPSRRLLQVVGVTHVYEGRTQTRALDSISLDVYENEFLAIVGPVGCGKTTLMRIVAGLLQPSIGTVWCNGDRVAGPGPERGYVFQEEAIFPWMTVRGNLELGPLAKGFDAPRRDAIIGELIALIGLEGYESAFPKELSGGMSKMVEVARVLATDPAILLLDEPFGLLDAQTRTVMQNGLNRLWERQKKTVILVTHDVEEALGLADRVVVFSPRPGRVKAEVMVDLPRPRSLQTRFTPEFSVLKRTVWGSLGLT